MAARSKRKTRHLAEEPEEKSRVTPMRSEGARKKAVLGELGASGTILQSGMLRAESNSKLLHTLAYGNPASSAWGEWQKLVRTDSAVADALSKVAGPLRDSMIEIEPAEVRPKKAKPAQVEGEVAGLFAVAPSDPERLDRDAREARGAQEGDTAEEEESTAEEARQQDIADYVSDCFSKWMAPTAGMHIEQVVKGGLGYGFALHEPVYGVREDERVPGGQGVYIRKMAQRLPNSIMQNGWIEKDGELSVIRQQGYKDGKFVTVDLPAEKVQLATWDRDGNNYAGFSAFRSVWYIGLLRAELLRIIGVGHQREACGVPVAYMDATVRLTDAERVELQELLETVVYHENAGFQLPPGVRVEWFFSPGANKGNVLETWKALGTAIRQIVSAEGGELGMDGVGARALGETKEAAKNLFVEGVRAWLEGVFNGIGEWPYTGIVKKLVDFNWGPQKSYPTLKLVTPKSDLPISEVATAAKTLSDAGAIHFTEDDEDYFRERLGLEPIDPAVREQLVAQKEAARAAAAEALKQAGGAKPEDEKSNAKAKMLAELMGEE